jgi:DNA-binding beta-propeller fold protein YncE
MKHFLLFITLIILSVSNTFAQGWTYQGNFPNDSFQGAAGLQGLAVDPDGKVWITKYGSEYYTPPGLTDSIFVRLIYVFNPDGTPASFSPIWKIEGPGFTDTLFGSNNRGLRADQNGNILSVTGSQLMYRINYQTGLGMNKINLGLGTSPTAPAVSEDGKIFVGPVVNQFNSIREFDSDFNFIGNAATFLLSDFTRSIELDLNLGSNKIYFPAALVRKLIIVYQRLDEFSPFDSVGTIMDGVSCESITFNKFSRRLWVSGGSYQSLPDPNSPYSPNVWYEYDVLNGTVTDSIIWQMNFPNNPDERPRAIDFSPDGRFAYVGCFGNSDYPIVQKFEALILPVELTSFNIIINDNNNVGLNWSTATEINNLGFEIQRKIKNSEWIPIAFKPGKGTTTEKQFYSYTDICGNLNNEKILYRLKQIDLNGDFVFSETKEIMLTNTNVPQEFFVSQNYPNPFNPNTKISWQSPVSGWQSLKVYDVLGNEVATLVNEEKPAGSYEVDFNASHLSSGVYYYQVRAGEFVQTKKMILLR